MKPHDDRTHEPAYRLRARTQFVASPGKVLLRLGGRTAKLEPVGERELAFLHLIAEGGTESELKVRGCYTDEEWPRLRRWLEELNRRGFLERLDVPHRSDPRDVSRFDRFLHYLSEFETDELSRFDLLERIRNSTVAVIGTGGTGSWVVYNLVCCGVGTLRLVDADRVEMSDLNRSILFSEDMVGMTKVEAAARTIRAFAPRTKVECLPVRIDGVDAIPTLIRGAGLVIGVADEPPGLIRRWIARACHSEAVPSIQASGFRVGPFCIPGAGSCAICDWMLQVARNPRLPEMLAAQQALPHGSSGGLSPIGSITGGILGMEALRFLVGQRPLTLNAVWEMDAMFSARLNPLPPDPDCELCGGVRAAEA